MATRKESKEVQEWIHHLPRRDRQPSNLCRYVSSACLSTQLVLVYAVTFLSIHVKVMMVLCSLIGLHAVTLTRFCIINFMAEVPQIMKSSQWHHSPSHRWRDNYLLLQIICLFQSFFLLVNVILGTKSSDICGNFYFSLRTSQIEEKIELPSAK